MNKDQLEKVLKDGGMSLEGLKKMQAQAKTIGLTKRIIHIELDIASGQFKSQATQMDNMTHLGMIEFYKATILGQILNQPITKDDSQPVTVGPPESGPAAPTLESGTTAA